MFLNVLARPSPQIHGESCDDSDGSAALDDDAGPSKLFLSAAARNYDEKERNYRVSPCFCLPFSKRSAEILGVLTLSHSKFRQYLLEPAFGAWALACGAC